MIELNLWFIPKNNPKYLSQQSNLTQQSNIKSDTYYIYVDLEITRHFLTTTKMFLRGLCSKLDLKEKLLVQRSAIEKNL